MREQHTLLPWHVAEYGTNPDGSPKHFALVRGDETIANFGTSERSNGNNTQANVMFAARACNSYDDMLEALRKIELIANSAGGYGVMIQRILTVARDAIAKAI